MDNYLKGADYERQIRDYLLLQPDVENAWLWKDIPEYVLEDAGILYDFEKTRKNRKQAWDTEHCLPDTRTDILAIKTNQPHTCFKPKTIMEQFSKLILLDFIECNCYLIYQERSGFQTKSAELWRICLRAIQRPSW